MPVLVNDFFVTNLVSFGKFSWAKYPKTVDLLTLDVVYVFNLGYGLSWLSTLSVLLSGLHKSIVNIVLVLGTVSSQLFTSLKIKNSSLKIVH